MKNRLMLLCLVLCVVAVPRVYALAEPLMVTTDLTHLQRDEGFEVVARIEFSLFDWTDATFDVYIDAVIFKSASGNDLVFDFEDGTTQGFTGLALFPPVVVPSTLEGLYMMKFTDDPDPWGEAVTFATQVVTLPHDVLYLSFLFDIEMTGDGDLFDAITFDVYLYDIQGQELSLVDPPFSPLYTYDIFNNNSEYNPDYTQVDGLGVIPEPVSLVSLLLGIAGIMGYRKRQNVK
ncbi:MAG: PEP-CTERM sorting domain-containing protein [Candidatus Auribacterota bacterium]|nr:PEP-CTERM sorting domain-containing protein [Candidatus Auribacterota bacterium]